MAAAASAGGVAAVNALQKQVEAAKVFATGHELTFGPPGARAAPKAPTDSRFKWSTSLDTPFEFDFVNNRPMADVSKVAWDHRIKGVQRSSAGAEGVFFVEDEAGKAVVVKGSRSIGSEIFSSLLATKLGICVPAWHLVQVGGQEGSLMMNCLGALDISGRVRINLGSQAYVLLKEYLPGKNLGEVSEERAHSIFGQCGALSVNGCRRLRELGRVLALDVLCNNGDRLPLIWDNRGNSGNVMLAGVHGSVVSVDSQIVPINRKDHPDQFQAYLTKVEKLVKDAVAATRPEGDGKEKEAAQFKTVRDKLNEFMKFDVGEAGTIELQHGFLEVVDNASECDLTAEELGAWRDALQACSPPVVGAGSADPEFVLAVWAIFQRKQ